MTFAYLAPNASGQNEVIQLFAEEPVLHPAMYVIDVSAYPGVAPGWLETTNGSGVVAAPVILPPTQAQLIDYLANARFLHETGGITIDGASVATDRGSQAMISGAYAYTQASGVPSISYKANSGWVTLDAATVKAIALAVGAHVQACFASEQTFDAEITAGTITTYAQIDALTWPS